MKKNLLVLSTVLAFLIGCASAPAPEPKKEVKQDVPDISSQNKKLAGHPLSGFAYKSSALKQSEWDNWAKDVAPLIKEIINVLPDGMVLQVTGHTDASGPEEPTGDKPGNIKISTDRAKTVYDAMKKANIPMDKVTYKGVGSDELLSEYDSKAPDQRRVTFRIVQK